MEVLNLKKLWEVMDTLTRKQQELEEHDIFVHLLGSKSKYWGLSFDDFLRDYSFKIEKVTETIVVYNDDGVPFEYYSNDDFSYIPFSLLSFSAEQLEEWMENEIVKQLDQQEKDKITEKERIELTIEKLKAKLSDLWSKE
jgi:hypothetical protein